MRIGKYIDGRELTYEQGVAQFAVGGTPVTLEQVLQYDDFSQIEWATDETRVWARALRVDVCETVGAPQPKAWVLLGFRSKRPWKMVLACVYYVFWAVFTLAALASRAPRMADARDAVIEASIGIVISLLMIAPALFLSDFGYRQRLPFFKHRKVLWSSAGFAVLFMLCFATIGLANSLHSQPYKAAVAADRAADESKQEARRVVAQRQATTQPADKSSRSSAQAEPTLDLGEMTNPKLIKNFLAACRLIGVQPTKIKKVKKLPDWASGERYTFMYANSELKALANADGTISSINIGNTHVYEQGFEPLRIGDYLTDWKTALELQVEAERAVRERLNYPATADFPWLDWGVGRSGDIYYIGGRLSAENAFGMTKDTSYYIEYQRKGESYSPKFFRLDGKNVLGQKSVIPAVVRKEVGTASKKGGIVLLDGTLGSFGQAKTIDGDKYIWYYVPPGDYEVTSQTNMTKLYLDKNKMIRNSDTNGYWECVRVRTLDFSKVGRPQRLSVAKGQHIELTLRAKVTLVPAK